MVHVKVREALEKIVDIKTDSNELVFISADAGNASRYLQTRRYLITEKENHQ